jgi:hypothetical protein
VAPGGKEHVIAPRAIIHHTGFRAAVSMSQFDGESEQRPTHPGVEQELILVVVDIQIAISEDECASVADVRTRDRESDT